MTVPEAWQPVDEENEDRVAAHSAAALHGLLDAPGPAPGEGDALPPLWHWLAFLPAAPQRDLGADGHPRLGGFLPPLSLPRRMFAGGRLDLLASGPCSGAPAVGALLRRRSRVTSVQEKAGRSGGLVFVEVGHELSDEGRTVISEVQELVYRGAGPTGGEAQGRPRPVPDAGPDGGPDAEWPWQLDLRTDPTLLFRFSALTYNAHRIHYDRAYATEVEGYPGLVVQGPLQAIALAELCRRHVPERAVRSFSFRALRPAFDGAPLHVRGRLDGTGDAELVVLDDEGRPTMAAHAELGAV